MNIVDHQNTKIVATVGPASSSFEVLLDLVIAGVNVFRLNFSHGNLVDHLKVIQFVQQINERYNLHIGIMADLQGPKIRIGLVENEGIRISPGDELTFTTQQCLGTMEKISINYFNFPKDVKKGERILLDDGKIVCEVLSTNRHDEVKLKVLFGSMLHSRKGVNLPDTRLSIPALSEKDIEDLEFVLTQPVNWVALSFVRSADDIIDLKNRIAAKKHPAKVIAKIEKPEAIDHLEDIINATDAVMIARGDLGIEVPMEKLPSLQKQIVRTCIQKGKPVIVATQLMDSMITHPSPTRAEITDVANAVLDGTDAVMLSGETSVGAHPVKVVEAMNKIIHEAENMYSLGDRRPIPREDSETYLSDVICINAGKTADEIGANGIVTLTTSGYTAFKISSYRPHAKIYVFSDREHLLSTLSLVWGVKVFFYDKFSTTDETIEDVIEILKYNKRVKTGDLIVNTGAMPLHKRLRTNFLKITVVE